MKRRTLLNSVLGSLIAFVSPVRGAQVSNEVKSPSKEKLSPFDAIKRVYDEFVSLEPESEFVFDDPYEECGVGEYCRVHCKLISLANEEQKFHDVWLIFNDSSKTYENMILKKRQLLVALVHSRRLHEFLQKQNHESFKEYSVEEAFRDLWRQAGKNIVTFTSFQYPEEVNEHFETSGMFVNNSTQKQMFEISVLSKFFEHIL